MGEDVVFKVHTQVAADGDLSVRVIGPRGSEDMARVKKLDPVTYECAYNPKKSGLHTIVVNYVGQPIAMSPFKVEVGPSRHGRVMAFGPGLETGVVGFPACFTVETNGETLSLGWFCMDYCMYLVCVLSSKWLIIIKILHQYCFYKN